MKKLLLLLLIAPVLGFGQDYGNDIDALKLCTFIQNNSFISDSKAENALDRILSVIGASKRFVLQPCDNINNAVATSYKGIRYIFYDKDFMDSLDSGDNWSNLFILAHEVGHHINGHSLDLLLYATEAVEAETLANQREQELEADEFAGFVLGKLGATLKQSSSSINLISSEKDDTYDTHPSKSKRLASIEIGYNKALDKKEKVVYQTTNTPQTFEEYYYSAYDKGRLKDYYGAIADFTKAIEIGNNDDSDEASAYMNRGFLKTQLKDYYAAIEDFTKAIEIDPNYIRSYVERGYTKAELKDYYGAIADHTKAIEIDPNYADAYAFRADSKSRLKDYYAAIEDFTKAIEIGINDDSNEAMTYFNRGYLKAVLKDYYGAIADYTKAIEIEPINAEAYTSRGYSKAELKDYYGAIADYTKAIEIDPNYANAYYYRAVSKAFIKDKNGSCQDGRKAKSLGLNVASELIKYACN
jgi:tetratricopeptide (TPR) repeat protein